jgi:hypothetical protein
VSQHAGPWSHARQQPLADLEDLARALPDQSVGFVELCTQYVITKRSLATAFQTLAVERYGDSQALPRAVALLNSEIARRIPDLPTRFQRVRGYGVSHRLLVGMLADRVGVAVSVDELRILTGDAIHTERRTRELRELGLHISSATTSGTDSYTLEPGDQDVAGAAIRLARKAVQAAPGLAPADRVRWLRLVDGANSP